MRGRRRSVTPARLYSAQDRRARTRSLVRDDEITYPLQPLELPLRAEIVIPRPPSPAAAEFVTELERVMYAETHAETPMDTHVAEPGPSYRAGSRLDPPGEKSMRLIAEETSPGRPGDMVAVARYRPHRATAKAAGVEVTQDVHGNIYNLRELTRRELSKYPLPPQDGKHLERSLDDYSSPSPVPVPAQDESGQPTPRSIFSRVARGKRNPVKRRHAYTPPKAKRAGMKKRCLKVSPRKPLPKRKPPSSDSNNNAVDSENIIGLEQAMRRVSVNMDDVDLDATLTTVPEDMGGVCTQQEVAVDNAPEVGTSETLDEDAELS